MSMLQISYLDLERSIARASYLAEAATTRINHLTTNLETRVVGKITAFFALVQVGANLLHQSVYMDTGSNLLWFFCEPCTHMAPLPLFDPKLSYTFENESCLGTRVCSSPSTVAIECDGMGGCTYEVRYGKGRTKGYLARDRLRFEHEGNIDGAVFGCAKSGIGITDGNGVLGLLNNSLSLMGQMGASRFAYCIGNITDKAEPYSRLLIGDQVRMKGYLTPLIVQGQYYINLEQIKIGDKELDIDAEDIRRNLDDYTGGLMLDTGSTYTFFPQWIVDEFHDELSSLIGRLYRPNSVIRYGDYLLRCYNGVVTRDLLDFPMVEFMFEDGGRMKLTAENIFRQFDNEVFCLAIIPSDEIMGPEIETSDLLMLGNIMQQYYYFAYDLKSKELSFMRMDCAQLDIL